MKTARKQAKILVVDDLPDWRATLSGMLIDQGYTVQVASSQAEACELLGADHFDLALLDMRLDETDESNTEGLDLAAEIERRWPGIKVVIITGYGTPDRARQAMEPNAAGKQLAAEFIEKTQTDKLVEIVKRVLEA